MRLNLGFISTFLTLAETKNFSRAAELLSLSQSTVSRQILQVEKMVGRPLVFRNKHMVELTEDGRRFVHEFAPIVEHSKFALERMQSRSQKLQGMVSIGSLSEIGQRVLAPQLVKISNSNPGLSFNLELDEEFVTIDHLKAGTLDMAIVSDPPASHQFISRRYYVEQIVAVTRKQNKVDLVDISHSALIGFRRNDALVKSYVAHFFPQISMSRLKFVFYVNSYRAMIEGLIESDAYAVMPLFAVEQYIREGILRKANGQTFDKDLSLIYPKTKADDPKIKFVASQI